MKYDASTIPKVDPMMVRSFLPLSGLDIFGGIMLLDEFDVEDVGMAEARMNFDDDVVDCSNRIFEITNIMILGKCPEPYGVSAFPSRRFRSHRTGMDVKPFLKDERFLYLGNPIRLFWHPTEGVTVMRGPEFLIKSGPQLGY
jgi:hypothetical protein